jgi:hypothetical protein
VEIFSPSKIRKDVLLDLISNS